MKGSRYNFNIIRLLNLWLLPVLFSALAYMLIYSKFENLRDLSITDILLCTFYFLFTVGVFVVLFFNHLPLARQTEIVVYGGANSKEIQIRQRNEYYKLEISKIETIIEYSTAKLPWSSIIKWKIILPDKEVIISSLTISRLNFERHFNNKFEDKTSLFPFI